MDSMCHSQLSPSVSKHTPLWSAILTHLDQTLQMANLGQAISTLDHTWPKLASFFFSWYFCCQDILRHKLNKHFFVLMLDDIQCTCHQAWSVWLWFQSAKMPMLTHISRKKKKTANERMNFPTLFTSVSDQVGGLPFRLNFACRQMTFRERGADIFTQ